MSRLAAVREVYERWSRGDYRAGLELYAPDLTLEIHNPIPDAGVYENLAGLQRYMRRFLETWEEYAVRALAFEEVGDHVVVDVHHRGSASGAVAEMAYVTVWTFDGERVVRVDIGRDRETMLGAARAALREARAS